MATDECPKSYVTAESAGWLEEFLVRRKLGGLAVENLNARQAEAYVILEKALAKETQYGEHGR